MAKGGAKVNVSGLDDVLLSLEKLGDTDLFKPVVYKGAGVVADTMKEKLRSLKTTNDKSKSSSMRYCYESDKQVLLESMGITPIKNDESVNAKVGFDGYYTNRKGEQKPIPLLANSVNAGTSFMYRQPFINSTKRASESKAVAEMSAETQKLINKEMK